MRNPPPRPEPPDAPPFGLERFATGGYVAPKPGADLIAPVGCPPFDPHLYGQYRDMFEAGEYEGARCEDEQ